MNTTKQIQSRDLVILYDTLHAGKRAKEMCDRVAAQLESDCLLRFHCWNFTLLSDPVSARVVATQVMSAPCLIVACNGNDELAQPVKAFLKRSARVLRTAGSALVAQLHGIPGGKKEQLPAHRCLNEIAATAGIPFFSERIEPVADKTCPAQKAA